MFDSTSSISILKNILGQMKEVGFSKMWNLYAPYIRKNLTLSHETSLHFRIYQAMHKMEASQFQKWMTQRSFCAWGI